MKISSWWLAAVCTVVLLPQTGHGQNAPYYFPVSGYGPTQASALNALMAEIRSKCRKSSTAQLVPGTVSYSPYNSTLIEASGIGVCDLQSTFPDPPPYSDS